MNRAKQRHSTLALLLLFLCVCAMPVGTVHVGARPNDEAEAIEATARAKRLAVFDDVWETIRARYYDPNFHGVDWQKERAALRSEARRARDEAELYKVLRRLTGALHDAHTRVFAPDEKFDWRHPRVLSIGISVREIGGEIVVVNVERASAAERAGLRAGDIVTAIDDQPAVAAFAKRLAQEETRSSTVQATKLRAAASLLSGAAGTSLKLAWRDEANRAHEAALRREWRAREHYLRIHSARGNHYVVEFDAFTDEVAAQFARELVTGKLRRARGLVIDLRGNGGGSAEAMIVVASALLPPNKSLGTFTDRSGTISLAPHTGTKSVDRLSSSAAFVTGDAVSFAPQSLPIVVLTSERTSSAAEIFAAALKDAQRAVIIGTNTCGCVLAIRRRHVLPDGGELDISEMDYRTAAGVRLEGAGVAPNESVALDKSDIRARRDRAIERALETLQAIAKQN